MRSLFNECGMVKLEDNKKKTNEINIKLKYKKFKNFETYMEVNLSFCCQVLLANQSMTKGSLELAVYQNIWNFITSMNRTYFLHLTSFPISILSIFMLCCSSCLCLHFLNKLDFHNNFYTSEQ